MIVYQQTTLTVFFHIIVDKQPYRMVIFIIKIIKMLKIHLDENTFPYFNGFLT